MDTDGIPDMARDCAREFVEITCVDIFLPSANPKRIPISRAGKFLTDGVVESPGLPGCIAI